MHTHMVAHNPVMSAQGQYSYLFRQGIQCLAEERWLDAEKIFSEIISYKSSYRENGRSAKDMLNVARNEREGRQALKDGDLEQALQCFRDAENLERTIYVEGLMQIEHLEGRAKSYLEDGRFRQAAWIYDQLLREFPTGRNAGEWREAQIACWHEELVPVFTAGLVDFENKNWVEAKNKLSEVVCGDPDFRRHGQTAAVLLDQCKREIRQIANANLNQGNLRDALAGFQEIMDVAKIKQVEELIYLQDQGEKVANDYRKKEKWAKAAAVYEWLLTLDFSVNKQQEWQNILNECQEKAKAAQLFDQGMNAMTQKKWQVAEKKFSQAKNIDPKFQRGGQRVNRLYRMAVLKHTLATLFP